MQLEGGEWGERRGRTASGVLACLGRVEIQYGTSQLPLKEASPDESFRLFALYPVVLR